MKRWSQPPPPPHHRHPPPFRRPTVLRPQLSPLSSNPPATRPNRSRFSGRFLSVAPPALFNFVFSISGSIFLQSRSPLLICYSACISYSINIYAEAKTNTQTHAASTHAHTHTRAVASIHQAGHDAKVAGFSRSRTPLFPVNTLFHLPALISCPLSPSLFFPPPPQVRTAARRGLLSVSVEMAYATRPS